MHQIITPTVSVLFPCRACSSATNLYIPTCTRDPVNSICVSMLLDCVSLRLRYLSLNKYYAWLYDHAQLSYEQEVHTEKAAQSYNRIEDCTKVLQATEPYDATSSPERDKGDKRTCTDHGQDTPLISRARGEMPTTHPRRDASAQWCEHRRQDGLG